MKIRKGFVSNSSSCSYVCEVCNRSEGGFDLSLDEAAMYECYAGHTFCESHINMNFSEILDVAVKEYAEKHDITDSEELEDLRSNLRYDCRYEMPTSICPICNLTVVTDEKLVEYLLSVVEKSRAEVEKEIREAANR